MSYSLRLAEAVTFSFCYLVTIAVVTLAAKEVYSGELKSKGIRCDVCGWFIKRKVLGLQCAIKEKGLRFTVKRQALG